MYYVALVIGELLILLILSDRIGKILYTIFFLIFRSKNAAIGLLTFIYLPGTVIHELGHLLTAEILRVPTGPLSFTPEFDTNKHGQTDIQIGSVKIAKTDPLRKYLIGVAPVFVGIFFLYLLVWIFEKYWPGITDSLPRWLFLSLIAYLLFAVSNNMFSSKKDLEGFILVVPIVIFVIAAIYFAGIRINLTPQTTENLIHLFQILAKALGIVTGINIAILLFNILFFRGLLKLFHLQIK